MSDAAVSRDASRAVTLASLPERAWHGRSMLHLASAGAARPWICRGSSAPLLAVLPSSRAVRDLIEDASALRGAADIPNAYALSEIPPSSFADDETALEALKAERGEAMLRWSQSGGIMAATPGALMGPFSVGGDSLRLACGETIARPRLLEWLASKGYERTDIVWSPGQYTYRGGIVDIYDPKDAWPTRIEFFDDEIDTMRFFATDTQRSIRSITSIDLRTLSSRREADLARLMPEGARLVLFEPADIENAADNYSWLCASTSRAEGLDWRGVMSALADLPRIRVTAGIERTTDRTGIISLPNFRGRRRDLESFREMVASSGMTLNVVTGSELWDEWAKRHGCARIAGSISEGFSDPAAGVVFIGDLELSGVSTAQPQADRRAPLEWGDRLLPGQWVVHEDYGVALFVGSEQIESPDGVQEYLVLEYAEESRLKIPVMHFRKISRYSPPPGTDPSADSLKSSKWKKLSAKARAQAEEAARGLAALYAKRETSEGRSFAGDPEQEAAFERAFPYRETRDQLSAIRDVEADMARAVPMDRLLVGDVGFGKTEVAMRAAAKCAFSGAQIALLAPTTLLAQQHWETWSARFDPFGLRVEVLSRFVTPSRQKKIIEDVKRGTVDVLIGTHRLLSGDISFNDLGLVIIDEEHRFGVLHKERLKGQYPSVDVLSLSATPIPRSLYMSLSGLRDMSLLETPPRARRPVITATGAWSEELVKNAVLREKNRGGQVFYVHDRVRTIDREALALRRLFPKLKIAVAHGQMGEKELKDVMDIFAAGEIDILVCTTIVESGLDLPRANTLIVSDSQDLGLAQMHQLRGRVGRRDEQAFALFLFPAEIKLTRYASERLEAIASLGEFGAGYELAKKDLEIRGGGELIGTAQHGDLGRVGFQRYCDLLEDAIRRARGDRCERAQVEVSIPSAIPVEYIPHESVRVALYRKLLWADDMETIDALRDETIDRFGPLPRVIDFLFAVATVKAVGGNFGIKHVKCFRDETIVQIDMEGPLGRTPAPPRWFRHVDGFIGKGGLDPLCEFTEKILRSAPM